MATPYVTAHLGEVPSTQDEARDRFAEIPVLVTAASQSAGRGRSNNEWWNAPRLVAASLAFEPSWPTANWPRLALVAGLAARDVLPGLWLEWPNDLVVCDGKVGGILAEADAEAVTVGLGLNLFWPDAPDGVGAVYGADPGEDAATAIAEAWCESLLDRANADRDEWGSISTGRLARRSAPTSSGSPAAPAALLTSIWTELWSWRRAREPSR